jgi:serine protease
VVAAAGNDGRGKVSYPARYPGVIAVAATQFDESTTFYSNWGKEIDIAAPGGNVRLDDNGDGKPDGVLQNTIVPGNITQTDYLWFMGTSMASPHVAGVAALIVGAGVTRPDAVEAILLSTARASKSGGDRQRFGAGIVDAKAALLKARAGVGAGGLGLGIVAAGAVILRLRRRQRLGVRTGLGFSATVLAVNVGATGFASLVAGNPLLWSAMPAILVAGLLYGLPRARPVVAGVAFGMAGLLAFGAIAYPNDIWLVPDAFDRVWLGANALICVALGALVLRR